VREEREGGRRDRSCQLGGRRLGTLGLLRSLLGLESGASSGISLLAQLLRFLLHSVHLPLACRPLGVRRGVRGHNSGLRRGNGPFQQLALLLAVLHALLHVDTKLIGLDGVALRRRDGCGGLGGPRGGCSQRGQRRLVRRLRLGLDLGAADHILGGSGARHQPLGLTLGLSLRSGCDLTQASIGGRRGSVGLPHLRVLEPLQTPQRSTGLLLLLDRGLAQLRDLGQLEGKLGRTRVLDLRQAQLALPPVAAVSGAEQQVLVDGLQPQLPALGGLSCFGWWGVG